LSPRRWSDFRIDHDFWRARMDPHADHCTAELVHNGGRKSGRRKPANRKSGGTKYRKHWILKRQRVGDPEMAKSGALAAPIILPNDG
jgi:hypothetical protein